MSRKNLSKLELDNPKNEKLSKVKLKAMPTRNVPNALTNQNSTQNNSEKPKESKKK
jgi:hypothetical protein